MSGQFYHMPAHSWSQIGKIWILTCIEVPLHIGTRCPIGATPEFEALSLLGSSFSTAPYMLGSSQKSQCHGWLFVGRYRVDDVKQTGLHVQNWTCFEVGKFALQEPETLWCVYKVLLSIQFRCNTLCVYSCADEPITTIISSRDPQPY